VPAMAPSRPQTFAAGQKARGAVNQKAGKVKDWTKKNPGKSMTGAGLGGAGAVAAL
jgi:hypothetical protein